MNLDQLENEANELQSMDLNNLSVDKLQQLVNRLTSMLDKSESLLSEIQLSNFKTENNETDNS